MPRALWLADVLTDAGLVVRPYPGWETRGKTDLDPRGVMLHHTVTKPTTADVVVDKILAVTGSSSTPAPLANYSTSRDGSVSIIAAGTANHGGDGNWNGLSGNKWWLGDEMKNLGTASSEPWGPKQLDAAYRAAAACLKHIGQDESWLMGHKEYATPPGRKTDPHTLNMNTVRATVKTIMEDAMTPEDKAEILAAIAAVPTATWKYPQKDDPAVLSTYQLQSRTKEDTSAIRTAVGALDPSVVVGITDADLAAIAEAVADEQHRRLAQ
jgi:hypothetical protein